MVSVKSKGFKGFFVNRVQKSKLLILMLFLRGAVSGSKGLGLGFSWVRFLLISGASFLKFEVLLFLDQASTFYDRRLTFQRS